MPIAHITFATRDVPATVAFLQQVFDWSLMERPANARSTGAWLEIGPDQELHLNQVDDFQPPADEGEYGRHLALGFPDERLDGIRAALDQLGAEVIEPQRPTPFRRFFFRDPNGYVFEVVGRPQSSS
jgi:catechol 2,3-dioxygenase-like lactoylglutathione lyase family enzyme